MGRIGLNHEIANVLSLFALQKRPLLVVQTNINIKQCTFSSVQFSSVQSLNHVRLFATP